MSLKYEPSSEPLHKVSPLGDATREGSSTLVTPGVVPGTRHHSAIAPRYRLWGIVPLFGWVFLGWPFIKKFALAKGFGKNHPP